SVGAAVAPAALYPSATTAAQAEGNRDHGGIERARLLDLRGARRAARGAEGIRSRAVRAIRSTYRGTRQGDQCGSGARLRARARRGQGGRYGLGARRIKAPTWRADHGQGILQRRRTADNVG